MKAWAIRPVANAFFSVRTIASWPIRSSKVRGRYLRAMTVYAEPSAGAGAAPNMSAVAESIAAAPGSAGAAGSASGERSLSAIESLKVAGWRPADDPEKISLRLLPSGPDRVGEASAHRRSPRPISRAGTWGASSRSLPSWGGQIVAPAAIGWGSLKLQRTVQDIPTRPAL